jgi:hypothetical protein
LPLRWLVLPAPIPKIIRAQIFSDPAERRGVAPAAVLEGRVDVDLDDEVGMDAGVDD